MTMQIEALPMPLRVDDDGVVRVGHTRVTLDTVVVAYLDGASPEEIVNRYPSIPTATHAALLIDYRRSRSRGARARSIGKDFDIEQ